MDEVTAALVFSNNAQKKAKTYTDTCISALPKGLVYKGAVNYYSNLPTDASIGDCYTVKYAGSSGTEESGAEYAWGTYEGTNQWIQVGAPTEKISSSISKLGELLGSGTWNQIWNHPSSGSKTDKGLTSAYSANNTITVTGTSTSTVAALTDVTENPPSVTAGHKYYLHLSVTGDKTYPVKLRNYTTGANITAGSSEPVIFTATENGVVHLRWSGNSDREVDMTVQFWLCDMTVAFGAGNEPTTVDEMTAMFPNSYYPYCTEGTRAAKVEYVTTAPTAANTDGLKICVLSAEPATKYDGWLYFVTGS